MNLKSYRVFFEMTAFVVVVMCLISCKNSESKTEKTTLNHVKATKSSPSTTQATLISNSSTPTTSTVECLMGDKWRGCDGRGSTQATYNVRPDGNWEFRVTYYGGGSCYKAGSGASTQKGQVSHEEYSLNKAGNCMELVNRQYW